MYWSKQERTAAQSCPRKEHASLVGSYFRLIVGTSSCIFQGLSLQPPSRKIIFLYHAKHQIRDNTDGCAPRTPKHWAIARECSCSKQLLMRSAVTEMRIWRPGAEIRTIKTDFLWPKHCRMGRGLASPQPSSLH